MKKTKIKFDFTDAFATKAFRIIFSIVVAVALWTYVVHSENPNVDWVVRNIQVQFANEDALTNSNLVLTDVDVRAVTLEFTGRRNEVTKLTNSNITLTVDLSEIARSGSVTGSYQLHYEIDYPSGVNNVEVTRASSDFVAVKVESLVTKVVEIRGVNECSIAEGYQSKPMIFDTETIEVSGPESAVKLVDCAKVTLERENVSRTIQENVDVVLIDAEGHELLGDNLTMSHPKVSVTLPIVMVKEIPLAVTFIYGASATENNVSYEINPKIIQISGDPDTLSTINQINLGTIDLTSFSMSTTETYPITLPDNVDNLSGNATATVQVEVLDQSIGRISANNIQYRNATEGFDVMVITQSLDILLRGPEESVNKITSSNIRIVADLSELGNATGTMSVEAKVYIDGYSNVDAIGVYRISISVNKSG